MMLDERIHWPSLMVAKSTIENSTYLPANVGMR